jgi:hypothetical protein
MRWMRLLFVVGRLPALLDQTTFQYIDKRGSLWPGSTKSTRPCHVLSGVSRAGRLAQDGRMGLEPCREMPARELDEEIPVAGEYPLRRRSEAMGKVRVLRS